MAGVLSSNAMTSIDNEIDEYVNLVNDADDMYACFFLNARD